MFVNLKLIFYLIVFFRTQNTKIEHPRVMSFRTQRRAKQIFFLHFYSCYFFTNFSNKRRFLVSQKSLLFQRRVEISDAKEHRSLSEHLYFN
jgi:hypothetical protein